MYIGCHIIFEKSAYKISTIIGQCLLINDILDLDEDESCARKVKVTVQCQSSLIYEYSKSLTDSFRENCLIDFDDYWSMPLYQWYIELRWKWVLCNKGQGYSPKSKFAIYVYSKTLSDSFRENVLNRFRRVLVHAFVSTISWIAMKMGPVRQMSKSIVQGQSSLYMHIVKRYPTV